MKNVLFALLLIGLLISLYFNFANSKQNWLNPNKNTVINLEKDSLQISFYLKKSDIAALQNSESNKPSLLHPEEVLPKQSAANTQETILVATTNGMSNPDCKQDPALNSCVLMCCPSLPGNVHLPPTAQSILSRLGVVVNKGSNK